MLPLRPGLAPHRVPLLAVLAAFVASRAWAWSAGVRFDASPLTTFWQYVDPELLRTHLAQSLWYLHSQPPLYNLLLGLGLKLFGSGFDGGAYDAQLLLGLGLALALYALLVLAGLGRWWSLGLTVLFVVSPATILFENWLFYEYLVTAFLVAASVAFAFFARRPTALRAFWVFACLGALCYTRSSFQIPVMLIVLGVMLCAFPGRRRSIVVGSLVPLVLVAGLMLKNQILFGTPSTSSWAGMNLMEVDQSGLRPGEVERLQAAGVVGPITAIRAFEPLSSYASVVPLDDRYADVPVLHEERTSTGIPNFDNITYVKISSLYLHDFVGILFHDPGAYWRGIWRGIRTAAYPSPDYLFFLPNGARMGSWPRVYDAAVLWQPSESVQDGVPVGTAWGLVLWYVVALVLGGWEAIRLLRRRGGSELVVFVWVLVAYAVFVMTLGEVEENQRVRFVTDPLVLVLSAVFVRRAVTALRPRLHWPTERP